MTKNHEITLQCFLLVSSYLGPRKFGKIDWRNIKSAAIYEDAIYEDERKDVVQL
jgi:hypothetical protein